MIVIVEQTTLSVIFINIVSKKDDTPGFEWCAFSTLIFTLVKIEPPDRHPFVVLVSQWHWRLNGHPIRAADELPRPCCH